MTRVETTVAMALAASFMPLRKSNANATAISATSSGNASVASIALAIGLAGLYVLDDDAMHHVGDVIKSVDHLLKVVVNLVADEKRQPVTACCIRAVKIVQALVVHLVGLTFQRRNLRREFADVAGFRADRFE